MLEELSTASTLLQSAIDRYLKVCVRIEQYHKQGQLLGNAPPELSSRLAGESQLLPLLETKLKEASVAINRARNVSLSLVPINSLPPELLGHIFHLLLGWQSRAERTLGSLNGQTRKYPATLSHVCSHWRHIAINTGSLWAHIDLCTLDSVHQGLLDRAEVYANRAGAQLLAVRLTDPPKPDGPRYSHAVKFDGFFVRFAARIKSLELALQNKRPRRIQFSVLSSFFQHCVPGIFTEFITSKNCVHFDQTEMEEIDDYMPVSFMRISDGFNHGYGNDLYMNVDGPRLEHIFHSLTVLCLDNIYPIWSSSAYRGLIELRLTCEAHLSEHQLVAILESCPGLRRLVLAGDINRPAPESTAVKRVALNDLEALHLHGMDCESLVYLLRWLAPGPKPLQVTLSGSGEDTDFAKVDIKAFFNRSNVTQLYASCVDHPEIVQLLGLCPRLEILVIGESDFACTSIKDGLSIRLPSLRALYMLHCTVDVDDLLELIEPNDIHTLAYYDCPLSPSQDEVVAELSAFCPDIRRSFLGDRHPIEEWDIFEHFEW